MTGSGSAWPQPAVRGKMSWCWSCFTRRFGPGSRAGSRRPDRAAGGGLAGDRRGPPHADRRADRVGQDPGRVPGLHRPALPGPRAQQPGRGRREAPSGLPGARPPAGPQVVYVSPLKALAVDIRQNLERPLAEIAEVAAGLGLTAPDIRVAVRTGDTAAGERAAMLKRPPDFLITTPESLYLLVTAERSRAMLASGQTVIVDEIHAVAGNKRGSHLALTLERLEHLAAPAAAADRAVGHPAPDRDRGPAAGRRGPGRSEPDGSPRCAIVDSGHRRELDLALELPDDELGAVASSEQMGEILDLIAGHVPEHRTTLVFVNTRRMAERVAHQLGERLGQGQVAAHHGSLSRDRRQRVETRLRAGDLRALVATASLELGIDIGPVELVCQIGSPRSFATFLQRVGRSNHSRGGTPAGRLYPTSRDELVECAALLRGARARPAGRAASCPTRRWTSWPSRSSPSARPRTGPRTSCWPWSAGPPRSPACPREDFDEVAELVSDGIQTGRGRRAAYLHRDRVTGRLRGRRGRPARRADLGRGHPRAGRLPGAGRARRHLGRHGQRGLGHRVHGRRRVPARHHLVADPPGRAGHRPGRRRPGRAAHRCRSGWARRPAAPASCPRRSARSARRWPSVPGRRGPRRARGLAGGRVRAGADAAAEHHRAPTWRTGLAAARACCRPWTPSCWSGSSTRPAACSWSGTRRSAAGSTGRSGWPCASGSASRSTSSCRPRPATTPSCSRSARSTASRWTGCPRSWPRRPCEDVLRQAVLDRADVRSPLAVEPQPVAGRAADARRPARTRPRIQRMEADDLMAAVFPALAACQENVAPGPLEIPDHPLVRQTLRRLPARGHGHRRAGASCSARIESGRVDVVVPDTTEPSVLAHEILNGQPFTFLDDAPLEERRSRAVHAAPRPAGRGPRPGPARPRRHRAGRRPGPARAAGRRRAARPADDADRAAGPGGLAGVVGRAPLRDRRAVASTSRPRALVRRPAAASACSTATGPTPLCTSRPARIDAAAALLRGHLEYRGPSTVASVRSATVDGPRYSRWPRSISAAAASSPGESASTGRRSRGSVGSRQNSARTHDRRSAAAHRRPPASTVTARRSPTSSSNQACHSSGPQRDQRHQHVVELVGVARVGAACRGPARWPRRRAGPARGPPRAGRGGADGPAAALLERGVVEEGERPAVQDLVGEHRGLDGVPRHHVDPARSIRARSSRRPSTSIASRRQSSRVWRTRG